MSLNSIFGIAKSSLFAHQQALSITSQNLANANNPTYTRQVVLFGATPPDHRAVFSFGTGVEVQDVLRIRNQVTDTQIRANNQNFYDANKRSTMLKQIESMFSEPSEYGLSNLMTSFFNSWDELAVDPLSSALRTDVIHSAQTLSEKIGSIHKGMNQTKIDIEKDAENVVSIINNTVEQIHLVNKQLYEASTVGHYANDLLDKRDALLEDLSKYASINVHIDENNVANVSIGGMFATDGLHHIKFDIMKNSNGLSLTNEDHSASASLVGGELNGLLEVYNNEIPDQLAQLETLTITLMDNVNAIHEKGYSITDPARTGVNFFSGIEKGVLKINEEILKDPYNIAVSSDGKNGNNDIALLLAALKDSEIENGRTLSQSYSDMVSGIANEINLQDQNAQSYGLVLDQLNIQKTEYSGVSTDEEMINVMQFQRSYDAAAKLINVADDLLETIIGLV
ncbi:MAG: flagellar hook-associated protein FlgK [Ignavibacteriae bacterium]|nr:flagellar hook-associated protein FlgK [Ignavibacteriota bacterium]